LSYYVIYIVEQTSYVRSQPVVAVDTTSARKAVKTLNCSYAAVELKESFDDSFLDIVKVSHMWK